MSPGRQTMEMVASIEGARLDAWLHEHYPVRSRSMWQRLIREGNVLVNGKPGVCRSPVSAGCNIRITLPPPVPADAAPEDIPLNVLFEDEFLLVIDKPPGMVVHPGAGCPQHTLVNALLHHCRGQLSGIGGVERPGIVHRLDKDTSGCLVIAKTDEAHRRLAEEFKQRTLEKIYLALVSGHPSALSGRIEQPIGRHPVHRHKMAVSPKGRPALTFWKQRQVCGPHAALIECLLKTGRTHQIRVHLAFLGHPLLGDQVYGRQSSPHHPDIPRQMLHAWRLSFTHPITRRPLACEAPVPADMRQVMTVLTE
ncbi:MAG: RluA family pseudouridine synthase [Verrucomicrobiae bacterium]|nr:RluA family pseudouridine synthase [Verrucomicrobiae bacterium]